MTAQPLPTIQRPRKWPRNLAIVAVLLTAAYFVLTSAPVVRRLALPKVAEALRSNVDVGDLSVSPWGHLELRDVRITPIGAETLAQISRVYVRFGLASLLRGKIQADEITLERPVVTLFENADGSRNLPKLPSSESKPLQPLDLDLHQVQLRDGSLAFTQRDAAGISRQITVTNLNLTLDQLVTGQVGTLTVGAGTRLAQGSADRIAGQLKGSIKVTPGKLGIPEVLQGGIGLDLAEAAGAFREALGLAVALEADVTPTEIRDCRLAFRRGTEELGRLRLSGPYDAAKSEVRLDYELSGLDRRVLVLVGGATGFDVGDTTVGAKGRVEMVKDGTVVASNGELAVNRFSLATPNGRTPVTDLQTRYKVSANLRDSEAVVDTLEITGKDGQGAWLTGALDQPMNLAWGTAPAGTRKAQIALKLLRFDLAAWRTLLGTNAPAGNLTADVQLAAEKDGRLIRTTFTSRATGLRAAGAGSPLNDGTVEFSGAGTVTDFNKLDLRNSKFNLTQAGTQLVSGTTSADWHTGTGTGGCQVTAEGEVPPLLGVFPVPAVGAQSGRFKLSLQASQKTDGATATFSLNLAEFTGRLQQTEFKDYQTTVQGNAAYAKNEVVIQRLSVTAGTGLTTGGGLDVTGRWDLTRRAGEFSYRFNSLNQSALGPWLAGALQPNRLRSLTLEGTGKGTVDLAAQSTIAGDVRVSDLQADDPQGQTTAPLNLGLVLDVAGTGSRFDLRRATLQLGRTDRAKNELVATGLLDFGTNQPAPSSVSLRSDGLDFTPYYQLLAGRKTNATPAAPAVVSALPPAEPGPVQLPLARLTVDWEFAKVFIGSVDSSAWKGKLDLRDSVVTLQPFELQLPEAPVSLQATINLGVTGWQYDWKLGAPKLELAPWVDTFQPDYRGKVAGRLGVEAAFKGAGLTGAGCQKNLTGGFQLRSTNLNIDLAGLQDARKRRVATLASKPRAGVLTVIDQAFGGGGGSGSGPGWYQEISSSPIDTLILRGEARDGRLLFPEGLIQSPVLRAQPTGGLTFAPVLNDSSLNIPVALALRGGAARQLGLTEDTNRYVTLPPLLTVSGTVGKPSADVNKLNLAQLVLKAGSGGALGGLLNQATGGKSGDALNRAGGLLNALTGADTNTATAGTNATPAGTNSPNRRAAGVLNLLNDLSRPRPANPAPAPATPPAPAPAPPKK